MGIWVESLRRSEIDIIVTRLLACCFLLATAALASAPASANVFEIGDDGAVSVRAGTGDVAWIALNADGSAETEDAAPEVPLAAITEIGAPQVPANMSVYLHAAASGSGLSPDLLAAVVWQESRWRADALSPKGAMGLAQLMPGTARALAVDARDPAANLAGGARYLRQMLDRFDGDVERALAAYNAGPGRVTRAGGIPAIAETRRYVSTIIDRLALAGAPTVQGLVH